MRLYFTGYEEPKRGEIETHPPLVIPAKAGIQWFFEKQPFRTPACAGETQGKAELPTISSPPHQNRTNQSSGRHG